MMLRILAVVFTLFLAAPADAALAENASVNRGESVELVSAEFISTATRKAVPAEGVTTFITEILPTAAAPAQLFFYQAPPESHRYIRIRCMRI